MRDRIKVSKLCAGIAALVLLGVVGSAGFAATLYVPSQYPTIQAAIDAAANSGDTIIVSGGTYGPINLGTKNIVITGYGTIDGSGVAGPAVTIAGGQSNSTILQGFYITDWEDSGISIRPNPENDNASNPILRYNEVFGCGDSGISISSSSPILEGNYIWFNWAVGSGGGIAIYGNSNVTLRGSPTYAPNYIFYNWASDGGGIIVSSSPPDAAQITIGNDTVISGNEAGWWGGGIAVYGNASSTISAQHEIVGNFFTEHYIWIEDNYAEEGGGIFLWGSGRHTLHQAVVQGNYAWSFGGGASISPGVSGSAAINYNWFLSNSATYGGGLGLMGVNTNLRNNTIDMNIADADGGGIYSYSCATTNVTSNVIRANIAARAGGIYLGGSEDIFYNYITDNSATEEDGGIRIENATLPWVIDNELRANLASAGAGGISVLGTLSFGMIANNLFEDNMSGSEAVEGRGGGIRVETDADSYAKIQNNTFVGNAVAGPTGGRGAAVFLDVRAPFDFANNIVANNLAGGGVYATAEARRWVYAFYNDVWNNANFNWGGGFPDMTGKGGNISANPRFVLGRAGNFYLSQTAAGQSVTSPCVNTGSITAVQANLANATTRTDHVTDTGTVDMGYHYRPRDDDSDGLPNLYELSPGLGSHPWEGDHPYSGLAFPYNPEWAGDASFDQGWLYLADYDGLTTLQEYLIRTNPQDFDTDADGLADGDEYIVLHTDPTKADTDGDGLSDGDEVNVYHTNPLVVNTGVYGFVTRADTGAPIAGATVQLLQAGIVRVSVLSDSSGSYRADASAGTYDVVCSKMGYVQQTAAGVVVTAGHATIQNFALEEATGIAGTVTSAVDGSAISGATVELLQGGVAIYTLTTDASGGYGAEVDAGTYDVQCSRSGYVTQTQAGVVIPPDTLVVVNFVLQQATGLTGRVTRAATGTAISGATLTLSQGGIVMYTTSSGPDGGYSIETAAGTYDVACSAAGYVDQQRTGIIISEGRLTVLNFALADSAQIRGTITRALDGDPIEGAAVKLYEQRSGRLLASTLSEADGTYAIDRNLAAGTVSVEVSKTGYITQGALITLTAGQSYVLDFALVLAPTRVQGQITRAGTTTGISGARVAAYQNGVLRASASSNLLGGYLLVLPGPGDYTLLVTATNYARQQISISIGAGQTLNQDFALTSFSGNPITLSSPGVEPTEGNTSTVFRYQVTYQHEWGRPAYYAYVYIDGRAKTMRMISGDAFIGATYEYSTTLLVGTHRYYFLFNDGKYSRRLPVSGSYTGPTVTQ